MEKRFIYGSLSQWNGALEANEGKYRDSIVFIIDDTNAKNGVKIYTQGAYFDTELSADEVKSVINGYLSAGKNITVTTKEDGKLEVAASSVDSLVGKKESTLLVEAKAVAGALTTPVNLTMTVENGVATFAETFQTLNGDTTNAVTAVFEAGENVTLEKGTKGLKINATDTTYSAGTGLTLNGTTFNHTNVVEKNEEAKSDVTLSSSTNSFDFDQYSYDTEGHITGKVTNTVTLPSTAFSDNNTEYEFSVAKKEGDTGKANFDVNLINKDTKAIADTVTLVAGSNVAMSLNGDKGIEVIAADTKYDLDATANATKGVDVNLTNQSLATDKDTITFVGGSNVEVALKDGKVEISSSYENDNTTYAGKDAIVVAQPTEGKTEGEVSLKIDESDIFLSQSASGLKANIEVKYDSATNYIYLEGLDNGKTTGFDASAFVKDSFVESVSYVDEDKDGNKGKFLKFVFVVVDQDGEKEFEKTTTTTYVDVTELVNTIYDVEGDAATYSVVEEKVENDGTVKFTVKNSIGALDVTTTTGAITVTDGLATTTQIKTAVEGAIGALDVDSTTIGNSGAGTTANDTTNDTVKVVDTITYSETDGKISVSATTTEAATKTYVDNAIAALDVESATVGTKNANAEDETVTVVDSITYSETDGKIAVSATTTKAATKKYVDDKLGSITHSTVSADKDSEYLTITPAANANGATDYVVKVSGIDTAISTAIGGLDADVSTDDNGIVTYATEHDGLVFDRVGEVDGKLDKSRTIVKYVDKAKLTNLTVSKIKYTGITNDDTIATAFEKMDAAWEWGTLTQA